VVVGACELDCRLQAAISSALAVGYRRQRSSMRSRTCCRATNRCWNSWRISRSIERLPTDRRLIPPWAALAARASAI